MDSLEPVEGDLVALIGNLRHRMAGDLSDAGIACKWNAEPCCPLSWLDATNALHVLRIFQEAIGNVLSHSNATEIHIGCREQHHNGVGYDPVYGARPLKRAVQRYLQDPLVDTIPRGDVPDGSTVNADEGNGALLLSAK